MFVRYNCSSFVEGLSSSINSLSGQKGSRTEFVRGTFRISFTIVMQQMLIVMVIDFTFAGVSLPNTESF